MAKTADKLTYQEIVSMDKAALEWRALRRWLPAQAFLRWSVSSAPALPNLPLFIDVENRPSGIKQPHLVCLGVLSAMIAQGWRLTLRSPNMTAGQADWEAFLVHSELPSVTARDAEIDSCLLRAALLATIVHW